MFQENKLNETHAQLKEIGSFIETMPVKANPKMNWADIKTSREKARKAFSALCRTLRYEGNGSSSGGTIEIGCCSQKPSIPK